MADPNAFYDMYVMKTSGLTLVAGCSGTEYCRAHASSHDLHSGFISAINSFSAETFGRESLKTVTLDTVQLNLKIDRANDLIFPFIHPANSSQNLIRTQLETMSQRFVEKYGKQARSDVLDDEFFLGFREDLINTGILQAEIQTQLKAGKKKGRSLLRLFRLKQ